MIFRLAGLAALAGGLVFSVSLSILAKEPGNGAGKSAVSGVANRHTVAGSKVKKMHRGGRSIDSDKIGKTKGFHGDLKNLKTKGAKHGVKGSKGINRTEPVLLKESKADVQSRPFEVDSDSKKQAVIRRRKRLNRAIHMDMLRKRREVLNSDHQHMATVKSAQLKNDAVAKEQKKHLRRVIRLHRIHRIALAKKDEYVDKQVAMLTARENRRHMKVMRKLVKGKKGGVK